MLRTKSKRKTPFERSVLAATAFVLLHCNPAFAQNDAVVARVVPLPDSVAEVFSPAAARTISPREKFYNVGEQVKKGDPIVILEHRYNLHDAAHISNQRWD